jgi:1-deoxy-D-xylulose-5-phosphate synthase
MSISSNVGALSSFLSRKLSSNTAVRVKREVEQWLKSVPRIGDDLVWAVRHSEDSLKSFLTPGMLFQSFGFNYLGPIDGHDIGDLVRVFEQVKRLSGPVLVHVLTKKGKGYEPAERNPTYFHGVGCFEPETGEARKFGACAFPSYTEVFGQTLCDLAEVDDKVVAITAAMPEGTGLNRFREQYPDRFVDVGICEQHAVTFAAGLATRGFKPAVAIYSTFVQRSYDQIVHDVCLQDLPVSLFLDRGGLVGEDGATHHGAFDLSFLRHIPNLVLIAPKDEAELRRMIPTALNHSGPAAVRYPRGVGIGAELPADPEVLPLGEGELLKDGSDAVVIAIGSRVHPALEAVKNLEADTDKSVALFNARFVRPLPAEQLIELAGRFKTILVVEENAKLGGFGSAVLEFLAEEDLLDGKRVQLVGLPDSFVEHGGQRELRAMLGLDSAGIRAALEDLLKG